MRIIAFFTFHFVEFVFWEFWVAALFGPDLPARRRELRTQRAAVRFRRMAVELGGVLIKLGQFVSTRVDVLPPSVIRVLEGLQDEVRPADFAAIEAVLDEELGDRLQDFTRFTPQPIAAASLGQVYRATLPEHNVVVKVQRPGIERLVATDLGALEVVCRWSMRAAFIRRRADMPQLLEEFSSVLWEELDYIAEANNAERFQRMFADDHGVAIPHVYRDYSTRRVLVMEDVQTIKITDYSALEAAGIRRDEVARRLLDTYLTQVFVERFFHADPHPGNIFIRPLDPDEALRLNGRLPVTQGRPFQLIFVDFGMVGKLTPQLVETLRQTFIAAGLRDARGLVNCYEQLGLLMPGADKERIIAAMKHAFDLSWGMSMDELSHLPREEWLAYSREFQDLLFKIPFRFPQNLIYLGRCAAILSGIATALDPDFSPAMEMQPYVKFLLEGGALDDAEPDARRRVWED
ncbi:MAG: AarF/ABC1/UbiB kinase family protein, partial [Anaerolineae bacterium]|nr:AarF/ABC1/UbiB kinase family protein [Anaerolineae bacterium]